MMAEEEEGGFEKEGEREGWMTPDFLEGRIDEWMNERWMDGEEKEGKVAEASRRTKHAIRVVEHCEVVITTANERAISPHIKVLANEGLFIIGKHKSSHNPISGTLIQPPFFPVEKE